MAAPEWAKPLDQEPTVMAAPAWAKPLDNSTALPASNPAALTKPQLQQLVAQEAEANGVPPEIALKMINTESGWNPQALSKKGAKGLGQLMPGTAKDMGVTDPYDPTQNIRGSMRYMGQQLKEFKEVPLALAAYNAGPQTVRDKGGIPDYRETRAYVDKITGKERSWRKPQWNADATDNYGEPVIEENVTKNLLAGGLKGAANIATTINNAGSYPAVKLREAFGLDDGGLQIDRGEFDRSLDTLGVNRDSMEYGIGKIGTETAGTLGIPSALGKGISVLPQAAKYAPNLARALETGGFSVGDATGLSATALRPAAGAVVGGGTSLLLNPEEDASTSAIVGGALPFGTNTIGAVKPFLQRHTTGKGISEAKQALANLAENVYGVKPSADRLGDSKPLKALASFLSNVPGSGRNTTEELLQHQLQTAFNKTHTPLPTSALPQETGMVHGMEIPEKIPTMWERAGIADDIPNVAGAESAGVPRYTPQAPMEQLSMENLPPLTAESPGFPPVPPRADGRFKPLPPPPPAPEVGMLSPELSPPQPQQLAEALVGNGRQMPDLTNPYVGPHVGDAVKYSSEKLGQIYNHIFDNTQLLVTPDFEKRLASLIPKLESSFVRKEVEGILNAGGLPGQKVQDLKIELRSLGGRSADDAKLLNKVVMDEFKQQMEPRLRNLYETTEQQYGNMLDANRMMMSGADRNFKPNALANMNSKYAPIGENVRDPQVQDLVDIASDFGRTIGDSGTLSLPKRTIATMMQFTKTGKLANSLLNSDYVRRAVVNGPGKNLLAEGLSKYQPFVTPLYNEENLRR